MAEEISPLEDSGWWMERLRKDAKANRPEALRLADQLDSPDTLCTAPDILGAAAELRRLVAVNQELLEAIYEAQRQLINLQPIIANGLLTDRQLAAIDPHIDMALQALASAEGEQK
jgi:hypothetical protein